MELKFDENELSFRKEVLSFLDKRLPAEIRDKVLSGRNLDREDMVRWQKILHEKGWIAPTWPKEYGGCDWTPSQQYIFGLECGLAGAPRPVPFGLNMVGPVIYTFGSDEQKQRHLPPILSSDVWWCQGYSEPEAGSDLASLKTSAVRDGDDYIINGTKIWTTLAQWADWMFCLVRTSKEERRQDGISFILMDMKAPGITVDPIITIDGGHHVNQVFLEDVRVPAENLVGEEGKGWTYAKFLLANERQVIADIGQKKRMVSKLKALARREDSFGSSLADDPDFSRRLAELEIEVMALEYTELRYLDIQSAGREKGYEPSILKVRGTELQQALSELMIEAMGIFALPYAPELLKAGQNEPAIGPEEAAPAVQNYLYGRAATIYGGSNEIQRNILAKMLLVS